LEDEKRNGLVLRTIPRFFRDAVQASKKVCTIPLASRRTLLTGFGSLGENAAMAGDIDNAPAHLPDRLCTWCKVPMKKRLVGANQFVHYTCPKCVFQHTTRIGPKPAAK
jgi:hypothetical protein